MVKMQQQMGPYRIRRADWRDWRSLSLLMREMFPELRGAEISYHLRRANHTLGMAETDRGPAGFYKFYPLGDSATAQLDYFGVAAEARHAGLGSTLLKAYEAHAAAMGCRYSALAVLQTNLPAIRFYERNGYVRCGEEPGKYRYARELVPAAVTCRVARQSHWQRTCARLACLLLVDLPGWAASIRQARFARKNNWISQKRSPPTS